MLECQDALETPMLTFRQLMLHLCLTECTNATVKVECHFNVNFSTTFTESIRVISYSLNYLLILSCHFGAK